MKSKIIQAALGLSIVLSSTAAMSAIITDTVSFNNYGSQYNVTDYHYGTYNPRSSSRVNYKNLTLDGFDSSLGTLNSVQVLFDTDYRVMSYVRADDRYNNWGYDRSQGSNRSTMNMGIRLTNPSYSSDYTVASSSSSCSRTTYYGSACTDGYDRNYGQNDGALNVTGINLDNFLDTSLTINLRDYRSATADSNDYDSRVWGYNSWSYWRGNVSVVYDYTVPEPSVVSIMGLGLLAMGIARRKIKK